jgi:hypothetical protein
MESAMNDAKPSGAASGLSDVLCAELKNTPHGDVFFRWYVETMPPDRFVEWLYGAFLYGIKFATQDEVQLPERPEPEDCERLPFDAYSGFQMLAYGRECAEAQRLMVHNELLGGDHKQARKL